MNALKQSLLGLLLTIGFTLGAHAADPIRTTLFGNLAVEGYDTVAYFIDNKATKGKKDFQFEWHGANWRFSSEEHLNLFKQMPEKYAPQYGGYCAWAVSNNSTAGIDPEQFSIVEGRLYLNYNKSIQEQWLPEKEKRIEQADKYWPRLVN